jgi:hypothetical protein
VKNLKGLERRLPRFNLAGGLWELELCELELWELELLELTPAE